MPEIHAVALDLDKTLLRNDRTISPYTKAVLDRCRAKGIRVIIATARPPRAIGVYEEMISPDAVVTMNGASLRMNEVERRSISIDADAVQRLVRDIERLLPGHTWSLEVQSGLYANFDVEPVWPGSNAPIITANTVPYERAYKVLVGLETPEDADAVRSVMPPDTYLEIAEGTLGMVIHKNATKMSGILMALKEMGVSPEETAAFGDDLADIEMIRACGFGVAVENARPEVKEIAGYIARSNEEDGVARWLEENALGQDKS